MNQALSKEEDRWTLTSAVVREKAKKVLRVTTRWRKEDKGMMVE